MRPDELYKFLEDYDRVKPRLCVEAIPLAGKNISFPHKDIEDISLIYRVEFPEPDKMSALITNQLLEKYGITSEQLHADAMESTTRRRPLQFMHINDVLGALDEQPIPNGASFYIATNKYQYKGAAALFYPQAMEKAAALVGGDFFVLPSSVHEMLILRDDGTQDVKALKDMVKEINATEVAPADRLTDNVYHYDAKTQEFELAEDFMAVVIDSCGAKVLTKDGSILKLYDRNNKAYFPLDQWNDDLDEDRDIQFRVGRACGEVSGYKAFAMDLDKHEYYEYAFDSFPSRADVINAFIIGEYEKVADMNEARNHRKKERLFGPDGKVEKAKAKADELNRTAREQGVKNKDRSDPSL